MTFESARTGARLRRTTLLAFAALVAVPSAVAAAATSGLDAGTDVPSAVGATAGATGAHAGAAAVVAADVAELVADPLHVDLGQALTELDAHVKAEKADVDTARKALRQARAKRDAARNAVAKSQRRVEKLSGAPAPREGVTLLKAPSDDTPVRAAAPPLAFEVAVATGTKDPKKLSAAREQLAARAAAHDKAASATAAHAREAEAELEGLEAAVSQKTEFVEQAQKRLAAELEDAARNDDAKRVAQIEKRQDVLKATLEAPRRAATAKQAKAQAAAAQKAKAAAAKQAKAAERARAAAAEKARRVPLPIGSPTGSFPAVPCPGGGSITIDGSLAHNLQAMMLAARTDGIALCGGGYRGPAEQIQLRIAHCGASRYAIYLMPSGQCSPPTARPGTSNHEQGLAIDFRCFGDGISSHASPCFQWLGGHAATYGFFNLLSEPWHWSVDGT